MRTCGSCGFENSGEDRPCPLCGASEVRALLSSQETLVQDAAHRPPAGRGQTREAASSRMGEVFAKRFEVEALVGRGGMGQVFRVKDLKDGTARALKVLLPAGGEIEDQAERASRFKREIEILAMIRHPAVLRIYAWGTRAEERFFVSELLEGHDLKTDIQRRGPWPLAEAAALAATVADALAAAHALGIVHRDIKPNNIMLAKDGSVRLLDFGLARGASGDMATLTRTGTIVGTPGYMSPEQFDGRRVTFRTDLYSLGVVLYEMLTGRLPFTGDTPIAVAIKHKTEPPPAPRKARGEVPPWLDRLVLRCLEKDPDRRPPSAAAVAEELRRAHPAGEGEAQRLPGGDTAWQDVSGTGDHALVLSSAAEKSGWPVGMTLQFRGAYFRLAAVEGPPVEGGRWTYRFTPWPEAEVFRRLVDYEEDRALRAAAPAPKGLSMKLTRWISGRRE